MSKRKPRKKLQLHVSTVRRLDGANLDRVVGGGIPYVSVGCIMTIRITTKLTKPQDSVDNCA